MGTQRTTKVVVLGIVLGLALFTDAANGQWAFTWDTEPDNRLIHGNHPLNSQDSPFPLYLQFGLYGDAEGGNPLGRVNQLSNALVTKGHFSGTLDFDVDIFDGRTRYIEIAFRRANDPLWHPLDSGRKPVLRTYHTLLPEVVGVGTSFPRSKLQVHGELRASGGGNIVLEGAPYDAGDVVFQTVDGAQKGRIWTDPSLDENRLFLSSGDNNPDMSIDNSGNVGIGTPIPGANRLTVHGSTVGDGIWICPAPETGGITNVGILNNLDPGWWNPLVQDNDSMVILRSNTIDDPHSGGLVLGPWSEHPFGIRISPTGDVGIGTTEPQAKLDVSGGIKWFGFYSVEFLNNCLDHNTPYIQIRSGHDGGLWGIEAFASSEKVKKNITDLEVDSSRIYALHPVSFNWRTQKDGAPKTIGMIAEEVDKILPQLVGRDNSGNPHHVTYSLLSVLMLKELQKLRQGLLVTEDGNIGIGIADPSCKLDVRGDIQARAYHAGDIFFQKDGRKLWRMFEDEAGLYVESLTTGKKYNVVLQESGSSGLADADTTIAGLSAKNAALEQRVADLEARLNLLAEKLP